MMMLTDSCCHKLFMQLFFVCPGLQQKADVKRSKWIMDSDSSSDDDVKKDQKSDSSLSEDDADDDKDDDDDDDDGDSDAWDDSDSDRNPFAKDSDSDDGIHCALFNIFSVLIFYRTA